MARLCKCFTTILVLFLIVCSLLIVEPAIAQTITTQSDNIPIIITTPTPTPSVLPTPSPTPTSNIALSYNEVSREAIGDDTKVVLEVTAQYYFGNPVTISYQNFNLTIITNTTIGIIPVTHREQTGIAKPLETGNITLDCTNREVNFLLTFQFQTKRQTFYGEIKDFTSYDVTYTESINSPSTPSPSPFVPELSWLAIVLLLLPIIALAVLVRHQKTSNLSK